MRTLEYVIPQLPALAPALLVYLVGVVLSLDRLKRLGKPAALALVGCGMLFLITLVFSFVQGFIVVSRNDRQWTTAQMGLWLGVVGIVRTLLYAAAFSLLLAAIFVDRGKPSGVE